MLTNDQKSLLKRAQRQAGITDAEYRETLQRVAGVLSSTDPRLGDSHLDTLLGLFEAIHWRAVDAGTLPKPDPANVWLPFRSRGYWARKNRPGDTSRDRHVARQLADEIGQMEDQLTEKGFGGEYLAGIWNRVIGCQRVTPTRLGQYRRALERTLHAKAA